MVRKTKASTDHKGNFKRKKNFSEQQFFHSKIFHNNHFILYGNDFSHKKNISCCLVHTFDTKSRNRNNGKEEKSDYPVSISELSFVFHILFVVNSCAWCHFSNSLIVVMIQVSLRELCEPFQIFGVEEE